MEKQELKQICLGYGCNFVIGASGEIWFWKKKKKKGNGKKKWHIWKALKKIKLDQTIFHLFENLWKYPWQEKKKMKSIIDITSFDFYVFYLYLFKCWTNQCPKETFHFFFLKTKEK